MDLERLITLKPDMVMAYLVAADFGQFRKVEELGIPVVINAEYLEPHPLGRAEWIKFMALFLVFAIRPTPCLGTLSLNMLLPGNLPWVLLPGLW